MSKKPPKDPKDPKNPKKPSLTVDTNIPPPVDDVRKEKNEARRVAKNMEVGHSLLLEGIGAAGRFVQYLKDIGYDGTMRKVQVNPDVFRVWKIEPRGAASGKKTTASEQAEDKAAIEAQIRMLQERLKKAKK
jgi:hypothetical protein